MCTIEKNPKKIANKGSVMGLSNIIFLYGRNPTVLQSQHLNNKNLIPNFLFHEVHLFFKAKASIQPPEGYEKSEKEKTN